MATYLYKAADCPAVQYPTAYINPAGLTPVIGDAIINGDTSQGMDKVNATTARVDAQSQLGGGGPFGVQQGTGEITAGSGLTANISAALFRANGTEYAAAQTFACTGGSANYLWLNASGTVVRSGDTDVPSGGKVFLGLVECSGSSIGSIDYSGRQELRSGWLFRQTADAAEPSDTPNASISFYAVTEGGLYLWNGTEYVPIDGATSALLTDLTDLEGEHERLARLFRRLIRNLVAQTPLGSSILDDELLAQFALALREA